MFMNCRNAARVAIAVSAGGLVAAILCSPGEAAPGAVPAGDPVKGKTVFARCAICHAATPGAAPRIGPNLAGVFGRKAGTLPGFAYSPAMKKSGLIFNEETLSRYLAGPQQVVPGTKMAAAPVANPQDRKNLIAYLKTLRAK